VEAARRAASTSRDKNRTPMQWRNSPNGGFCPADITPWLPVNPNYAGGINVMEQEKDLASLLSFYRALIRVRKTNPALVEGDYDPIDMHNPDCLVFRRSIPEQSVLVMLNFSENSVPLNFNGINIQITRLLFSSTKRNIVDLQKMILAPFDICLMEMNHATSPY